MSDPPKHAVITGFLSKTRDRFHEYNEERDFEERLRALSEIDGFSGVEIVYPYEVPAPAVCRSLLESYGFEIAAINANVKAEPEFRSGGLTSVDSGIREKAVEFIKQAKDYARAVGAGKVTCCPLADGYEFHFNCDYGRMWSHLVESFGEAASHMPEIPLFIEYKPSETRGRCFVDTAAKALCLLHDIGDENIGVTIDYGHSKYGQENPAEILSLLAQSRFPYYVHINDNNAKWDWDYMVGAHNFLGYVEFLYYLQEYGYDDYLTSDTSPTRWDIRGTFEVNSRLTTKIWNRLNSIDRPAFKRLIGAGEFLETWKFIETHILSL